MAYRCLDKDRKIYFKKDSARAICNVSRIILDFDGVLVYTSESFRQTIRNVVDYYFLEILGLEGEKGRLVTLGDVQKFKDTGLYNNDWNLSFAFIAYYLAIIVKDLQRKRALQDFAKRFINIQFSEVQSFLQILREVGDFLRSHGINSTELVNMKNDNTFGLELILARTSMKNSNPLETALAPVLPQIGGDELTLIEKLVPYDLEKPDLLKRLFEESYLGRELFNKFYGGPSVFKFDESFLEKEAFIPTEDTLDMLRLRFRKFAIYSEKPKVQGTYLLDKNNFTEYFDTEGSVFLEDLTESKAGGEGLTLCKPNPTIFMKLIETLVGKVSLVAYVGDGVADAFLIKNARMEGVSNLLFLGVLCSSPNPNELLSQFIKHEADAVMTDVNDIPNLLAWLEK